MPSSQPPATTSSRQATPAEPDHSRSITIHQVYELWLQLPLSELTDARDRMLAGETYLPRVRLQRCHAIERVLVGQVDVIDTTTPQDFLAFRTTLAPASGFQSAQFREIEFLSGLKDPSFPSRLRGLTPDERARLLADQLAPAGRTLALGRVPRPPALRRLPNVHTGRSAAVPAHDRPGPDPVRPALGPGRGPGRRRSAWSLWRARHVLMAERQIGTKPGTGGSVGTPYLRGRLDLRFYPDLWHLRSTL